MVTKQKVAEAYQAMQDLGISESKVKPVLTKLLKLYDQNWEFIVEGNYRALADAIFEDDDFEEPEQQKINKNVKEEEMEAEESLLNDEPAQPLKRSRPRGHESQDMHPVTNSSPSSAACPLKKLCMGKATAVEGCSEQQTQNKGLSSDGNERIAANLGPMQDASSDMGKQHSSPQVSLGGRTHISERVSPSKQPAVEHGKSLLPSNQMPHSYPLVQPKEEHVGEDEVPIAMLPPVMTTMEGKEHIVDQKKKTKSRYSNLIQVDGGSDRTFVPMSVSRRPADIVIREPDLTPPPQLTISQSTLPPISTPQYYDGQGELSSSNYSSSSPYAAQPTVHSIFFHDTKQDQFQHQPRDQAQQQDPQQPEVLHMRSRRRFKEDVQLHRGRFVIYPFGDSLEPSKIAAKHIRKAIQSCYKKYWATYGEMSDDEKKTLFVKFSTLCTWEPQYDVEVQRLFHRLARQRFSDMLYDERSKHDKDSSYRPHWISEEIWGQLLHYWVNDKRFKKRSTTNKKNRTSSTGGNLHTNGSVTSVTHARHMKERLGRKPSIDELHRETHVKVGTNVYVDHRASSTHSAYQNEIQQFLRNTSEYSSQEDIPEAIKLRIWEKVSGKGTKHKRYGLGKMAPNAANGSMFSYPPQQESTQAPSVTPEVQTIIHNLTQELQHLRAVEKDLRKKLDTEVAARQSVEQRLVEESMARKAFEEKMMVLFANFTRQHRTLPIHQEEDSSAASEEY